VPTTTDGDTILVGMSMGSDAGAISGLGLSSALQLYSNIIVARFALSWFPQLYSTFPFLSPIYTVTEPYLVFFRRQIPAIGGFDISAIPALLLLDFAGKATAAFGDDRAVPSARELKQQLRRIKKGRTEKDGVPKRI
jgi:uncharacterized protein YggT (Ycf19 family)